MVCENCGSPNLEYTGVDGGYGEFGTELCDVFFCEDCGWETAENCVEGEEEVDEE
jgi:hypothetical protein